MIHKILAFFGLLTLDHIVSDFQAIIKKLEAHVKAKDAQSFALKQRARKLDDQSAWAADQAERSAKVRNNLADLIGEN